MILRGLLVNKSAKVPPSVKKAVELKNFSTKLDMQVHEIIELCEETVRIPWRHLAKEHNKTN
jgi:Leu/Phe-tRNA-protein transferase